MNISPITAGLGDSGQTSSSEVMSHATPSTATRGFTAGPWDVAVHEIDGARSIQVISQTGGVIALCKSAQGHKEANASLIAAAPAMLSELVDTDETLTKLITDLEGVVIAEHLEILIAWQRSVRATISQARGV